MPKDCELAEELADDEVPLVEKMTPEVTARSMKIWWGDWTDDWRTNFPPPAGFVGDQNGRYVEGNYSRSLTAQEEQLITDARTAAEQPFILAGEKARNDYFADLCSYLTATDSGFMATIDAQNDADL